MRLPQNNQEEVNDGQFKSASLFKSRSLRSLPDSNNDNFIFLKYSIFYGQFAEPETANFVFPK
jgi:hypothetical protein